MYNREKVARHFITKDVCIKTHERSSLPHSDRKSNMKSLQLFHLTGLTLSLPQLLGTSDGSAFHGLVSAKSLEGVVEQPFGRMLDRLVEHIR